MVQENQTKRFHCKSDPMLVPCQKPSHLYTAELAARTQSVENMIYENCCTSFW